MPFLSIKQDSFPFLALADEAGVLPWDYGRLFALRLSTHFLRITPRGVQFSLVAPLLAPGAAVWASWTPSVCEPTLHALCREGPGLVLFPDTAVDVPYNYSRLHPSAFIARFGAGACTSAHTARAIRLHDTQYELSLCDLMDANLDIILDTSDDRLYWRTDTTGWVEYVAVSLASVYYMSCISANVIKLARREAFAVTWLELLTLVGVVAYVAYSLAAGGLRWLVTADDALLARLLLAYLSIETCGVALPKVAALMQHTGIAPELALDKHMVSGISLYTAAVLLLALRVHYTFDNPYTSVLAIMFGTRSFVKLFTCGRQASWVWALVACDFATFCAVLGLGVGPAASNEFEGCLAQATAALTSMLVAVAFEAQERA